VPVTYTFTITLMNQGTGVAWNPDNTGGFFVDVFVAPVRSYPFERWGEFFGTPGSIKPGLQSPVVITQVVTPRDSREPTFYVKVDNHSLYPYGLVPEFNEMNNLGEPIHRIYLPVVLR
jgi:hypothetical protein